MSNYLLYNLFFLKQEIQHARYGPFLFELSIHNFVLYLFRLFNPNRFINQLTTCFDLDKQYFFKNCLLILKSGNAFHVICTAMFAFLYAMENRFYGLKT